MRERMGLVLGFLAVVAAGASVVSCSAPGGEDVTESDSEPLVAPAPFYGDPANGAVFAIDISGWQGPMSQAEMDCFWDAGVRHVVAGTQIADVTRQQLAMATSRGMTTDAYVYLYWDKDMAAQVETAFSNVAGAGGGASGGASAKIGRMWLDIEQATGGLGAAAIVGKIGEALTACRAHGVECGFYTGMGFWRGATSDNRSFDDVPLWYAIYDERRTLSYWPNQSFGGFTKIAGKQFDDLALCKVGTDRDVMQVLGAPSVVVDRTLPPDTGLPPPAPSSLYPTDGSVDALGYAKLMSATIARATSYQLALEHWNGTAFVPYYTWTSANAFVKATPSFHDTIYRFRVRAQNAHGWGAWSAYATFDYGTYTGPRPAPSSSPSSAPSTPPPPTTTPPAPTATSPAAPPAPPPPAGVPGSLAPNGGTVTSSAVTLSASAVAGATSYDFAIDVGSGATFSAYVTYATTTPGKTFYPQVHGKTYRWRVRAHTGATAGDWSIYATFDYP